MNMAKNEHMSDDLTVLILSCDKYRDLWKPLFYSFHKYWPDCPYPVYLGSNTVSYKDKKVKTLLSGPDIDWSTSLLSILAQMTTPYVFIWIDDVFPKEPVSTAEFSDILHFMKKMKAKHIHMQPTTDGTISGGDIREIEKGAPYRANVLGFWEAAYLQRLLLPGESPWNFEIMGSYRSRYTDGFYCLKKKLFRYVHVIEKGRYFREAVVYCQKHHIPLSTDTRPVLKDTKHIKSELQKVLFLAMKAIPWKIRVRCMNVLRKLLISY
jgi:hypothetical protein